MSELERRRRGGKTRERPFGAKNSAALRGTYSSSRLSPSRCCQPLARLSRSLVVPIVRQNRGWQPAFCIAAAGKFCLRCAGEPSIKIALEICPSLSLYVCGYQPPTTVCISLLQEICPFLNSRCSRLVRPSVRVFGRASLETLRQTRSFVRSPARSLIAVSSLLVFLLSLPLSSQVASLVH